MDAPGNIAREKIPETPHWPPREAEPVVEQAPSVAPEQRPSVAEHVPVTTTIPSVITPMSPPPAKSAIEKGIENILEEDIDKLFAVSHERKHSVSHLVFEHRPNHGWVGH